MGGKRLVKARRIQQEQRARVEPVRQFDLGVLIGESDDSANAAVTGRGEYVWVSEFNQPQSKFSILNRAVQPVIGLTVKIGYPEKPPFERQILGVWDQIGTLTGWDPSEGNPFDIGPHRVTHQWPSEAGKGTDAIRVYAPALMPLKLEAVAGMEVLIRPYGYWTGGEYRNFPGFVADLTYYRPAIGSVRYALVYLDTTTNGVSVVMGAAVTDDGVTPIPLPDLPQNARPSAMVRLTGAQTAVLQTSDVIDVRDWLTPEGAGSASLPEATCPGEILISVDGLTFEAMLPVVDTDGYIVTDTDGRIVVSYCTGTAPSPPIPPPAPPGFSCQSLDWRVFGALWWEMYRDCMLYTNQRVVGQSISSTRNDYGLTLTPTWEGNGVLAENELIYMMPTGASHVLIINPAAGTAALEDFGLTMPDIFKWAGGVLGVDGRIYGVPALSPNILIIDPAAGTAVRDDLGEDLTIYGPTAWKWWGGVLGGEGIAFFIPHTATDILFIDTKPPTPTAGWMGKNYSGTSKWSGGALGPDGKVYGIPSNYEEILIIDPEAMTATTSTMGLPAMTGTGKWAGGVTAANGKIYCIPLLAEDILIIDPVASTAVRETMGLTLSDSGKWSGGVLGPDGKIYGVPWGNTMNEWLIIDPVAGTATTSDLGATLTGADKWSGGVLATNSAIYTTPYAAPDVGVIEGWTETYSNDVLLSPYLNKF